MKKISLFALALFSGLAMFAQDPILRTEMSRSTFFGVKAGANWAKFDVDEFPGVNVNNKTSLHAGIFLNMPLGSTFNFQPELLYNGVGSKIKQQTALGSIPYEQDLSYVSLPLMFQYRTPAGLFFELGPQPSLLISAKAEGTGIEDSDNKDDFDKFDLAINGGLGYTTRVGFGVHARYSYGVTNVLEDGGGDNSANDGPELKNRVIQVGLHYMFGANK